MYLLCSCCHWLVLSTGCVPVPGQSSASGVFPCIPSVMQRVIPDACSVLCTLCVWIPDKSCALCVFLDMASPVHCVSSQIWPVLSPLCLLVPSQYWASVLFLDMSSLVHSLCFTFSTQCCALSVCSCTYPVMCALCVLVSCLVLCTVCLLIHG